MKKGFVLTAILLSGIVSAQAMDLKESVKVALRSNPQVVAAQKKADAAGAKFNQAVGAFFPTINLNGNLGRNFTSPSTVQITSTTTAGAVTQTLTFGTNAPSTAKSLQAALSQPVFVAALFPGYGLAKKGFDMAREDYNQVVINTSFNVAKNYFGVIMSEQMLQVAVDSKTSAQSHLDQVTSMYNSGVATKADLLRSEVQVANFDVALTKAQNNVDLAKDAFNNALGVDLLSPVVLDDQGFSGAVAAIPDYQTLLKTAFDNRPDWKAFQYSTGISEDTLHLAQTEYLPSVLMNANIGNSQTEYPTFQSDVNNWQITGAASWKLFDGLARENKVREAASSLAAQKANEDQIRNDISLQVRDAFLNLRTALQTVGQTKKAVDSATEGYKVTSSRYLSGVGTNVEVLDSQVDLAQAKANYVKSIFDVELAKAKINQVVGKVVL